MGRPTRSSNAATAISSPCRAREPPTISSSPIWPNQGAVRRFSTARRGKIEPVGRRPLLGVSEEQVYADYLRSNQYILPAYKKFIDAFVAKGGNPQIPSAVFGVKEAYLNASFDEMRQRYGTIENYFANGLGVDSVAQQSLRKRLLEHV